MASKVSHLQLGSSIMSKFLTWGMLFLSFQPAFAQIRCETVFSSPVQSFELPAYGVFKKGYKPNFEYKVLIPDQSAVKDQCGLGTCHLYSWTSLLEHDYKVRTHEDLKISAEYLSAMHWIQKSLELLESKDDKVDLHLGAQVWTSRSAIINYGIIPEGVWAAQKNFSAPPFSNRITEYVTNIVGRAKWEKDQQSDELKKKMINEKARFQIYKIFQSTIGELPKKFDYQGKTYTPHEFQKAFFPELNKPLVSMMLKDSKKEAPFEYEDPYLKLIFTDFENLEATARHLLDKGMNVYLGYDHNPNYMDRETGVMSIAAFQIPQDGGPLSREQRAFYKLPIGGHAVQIVGYDFDPKTNKILKWKIKNSWGISIGDQGYFHMDNDYFRAFAYSINFFENSEIPLPEIKTKIPNQIDLPF